MATLFKGNIANIGTFCYIGGMNNKKRIIYDLSEPISEDDPPKIKRMKLSFRKERDADCMFPICLLLCALALLVSSVCH